MDILLILSILNRFKQKNNRGNPDLNNSVIYSSLNLFVNKETPDCLKKSGV